MTSDGDGSGCAVTGIDDNGAPMYDCGSFFYGEATGVNSQSDDEDDDLSFDPTSASTDFTSVADDPQQPAKKKATRTASPCDASNKNNAQAISWISQYGVAASAAAGQISSTEVIILALSAVESGWGTGPFAVSPYYNFFSQHAPAPNAAGSVTINGNYMATYASYAASATGFDLSRSGVLITGVANATAAATDLQNAGYYGINRDGSKDPNFVTNVATTAAFIAKRIDCVK